jgi:hypothetical protein
MEFPQYLTTLRRRWFVPLVLVVIAIAGVFVLNRSTHLATAQVTVSVLDPFVAAPGTYTQAQVPFDAIIKSEQLADRVARLMGSRTGSLSGRFSVTVVPPLSGGNLSPLYAVRGTDRDPQRAIILTNLAVQEGRALYAKLNSTDFAQADAQLLVARDEFNKFASSKRAGELPSAIQKQMDAVSSLRQAVYLAQVAQDVGGGGRPKAALERAMATAQAELDRLTALEPEYKDLVFKVQLAEARVLALNKGQSGQTVSELFVKTLDGAQIRSDLTSLVLQYALGVLLGLVSGLSVVYLLAKGAKQPETASDVARAFRAPVLIRIPKSRV